MNVTKTECSRRYQTALRRYLQRGPPASLRAAARLGREAAALGLETLDLALIHEQAMRTWGPPGAALRSTRSMMERAKSFFAAALVPIEKTHRTTRKGDRCVHELTQALQRRAVLSSTSIRRLKRSIIRREGAEEALRKSKKQHAALLADAHRLQTHLRQLTRRMLSAQEHARRTGSRQLHDEIAQTLVAISVRLLTLKTAARANTAGLKKEIAQTQGLVTQSTATIHRLAHEFEGYHES